LPSGGLAVASTTGRDVVGFTSETGRLVRAWVGHPGGTVTALGTSGDVTVVGTTEREVIAYGPRGRWVWERRLPDVLVVPPVAVDATHLVLTTVGGGVTVVDPSDGTTQWKASMSDQVRVPPATDGDHVVVADAAGRLEVRDVSSGRSLWHVDGSPATAVQIVDDVVVVLGSGTVQGLRLDDGSRLWARPFDGVGADAVVDLGDVVAVATSSRTAGLDPDSGQVEWEQPGASATVGIGEVLLQIVDGALTPRDSQGGMLWYSPSSAPDAFLTPSTSGVWVTDSTGNTLVGPTP